MLAQAQATEIPFNNDDPSGFLSGFSSKLQPIKYIGLRVERGLSRIQIFRLRISERAASERDRLAAFIPDRKHQPPAKAVVRFALVVLHKKPSGEWILQTQVREQSGSGRISQPEAFD